MRTVGDVVMVVVGLVDAGGHGFHATPRPPVHEAEGVGLLLILRAFGSGATAMTGIEAISDGIPAFRPVEWRNARTTLTWMVSLLVVMFVGTIALIELDGIVPQSSQTVLSQLAHRNLGSGALYGYVQAATALVLELCGGEPGESTEAGAPPAWQRTASLRFERIADLGGSGISADEAVASLERLGCAVQSRDAGRVTVAVPPWRNDVAAKVTLEQAETLDPGVAAKAAEGCAEIEPECDLVEEVLRLRGLDAVRAVSLPRGSPVPVATLTPRQVRTELARQKSGLPPKTK